MRRHTRRAAHHDAPISHTGTVASHKPDATRYGNIVSTIALTNRPPKAITRYRPPEYAASVIE